MATQPNAPAETLASLSAALGFRRLQEVRMIVGGEHPSAVVTGVAHRYPCTTRVSLRTAARLVKAGAPLAVIDAARPGKGQS